MKLNIIIFAALVVCSCAKSNMLFFDTLPGIDFLYKGGKSVKYSFYNKPDLNDYNFSVPIQIMGSTVDYDREVNVSVFADSTTATSNDYKIIGGVIKANEYDGFVIVKFINNEILKTKTLRLWLEIDNSKDFVKGNVENKTIELLWDNRLAEPANWRYYEFGAYSSTVHNFMIETLGIAYIEYGQPDDPNVPNISWLLLESYRAQLRTALKVYNKAHPNAQMRHEDGVKKDELVVIP